MKSKNLCMMLVLLLCISATALAQEKNVSGTVSDQNGFPLPGVNIVVAGTSNGTQSDFDGKYSIMASQGQTLVFSYLGQKDVSVAVGASNTINVQMEEDAQALEEVVVVGAFGIKKQARSLGYAATKVSAEDLTEVVNTNPLESLSGSVPGVDISAPAQPGASAKVISRGFGSITGSNTPLYVINGSPVLDRANGSIITTSSFDVGSGVVDLDPNNIESINFLKGAAATALYGSRAANGAIIITTKTGKGRIKVDVSSSIDFNEVGKLVDKQQQFGTGWAGHSYSNVTGEGPLAASNENGSWGAPFDGEIRAWSRIVDNTQLIKPYVPLEDNVREFFDIGHTYTNSITISGGDENANMAFTYSRVDSDGIFPTDSDSFKKDNFGLNTGLKVDKLAIKASANITNKDQWAIPSGQGDDAAFGKSLMQEMIQMPNDISIVDMEDQSNIFNTPSYFYTPYAANPYVSLESNKVRSLKNRFFGNVNLNYELHENFNLIFQIGGDVDNEYIKRTGAIINYIEGAPQNLAGSNEVVGAVGEYKYSNKELDTYLNLNFNKDLNEDLNLNILAGFNYNQRNGDALSVVVTDLDLPDFYELSNSASTPSLGQSNYLRRVFGLYGSAELGFMNRYFLTLTARNDNSSTLPIQNNSYFYPSASLAAVVVDTNSSFVKLRGGYARIGNDTGLYQVYSTAGQAVNAGYFGAIEYPFAGLNSYEVFGRIENQNLKPEITDELEFGLETQFFNNRIGLDVSLYQRDTKDLIVDLNVPRSTGYNQITGNFVDLQNKGIELAFTAKPIRTQDFEWSLTYTFAKNESEVTHVEGEDEFDEDGNKLKKKISIYSAYDINFYAQEGQPLGVFYGPAPETTNDGEFIADPNTGYYTYDGKEHFLGTSQRDFIMGLQNSFEYKGFRLSANWDWKQGGKMYSYTKRLSYFVGNGQETTYNDRNPFILPNSVIAVTDEQGNVTGYEENTTYVDYEDVTAFYNASQNQAIQSEHIIDKSFIRLRSAALTYSFPSKFVQSVGLTGMSLSLYGKNLFLWTPSDNTYVDPETTSYGRGIRSEFGEFATNPAQRAYGARVKFSF
ncbi:SusC/RagA family TonB-linked outer membrane protein [Flagellimonas sp.]|uniref:SusC/RagA family TonB-linked outer membrane protein n=1 Tax=Flagellimonas sp. TaxID=2058762 RepID=UPI003BAFC20B